MFGKYPFHFLVVVPVSQMLAAVVKESDIVCPSRVIMEFSQILG